MNFAKRFSWQAISTVATSHASNAMMSNGGRSSNGPNRAR